MAGNIDFLGRLRNRLGFEASDSPFGFNLDPQQPLPILFQDVQVPTENLASPEVAGLTGNMPEAAPEESGGFSATEALFDTLDVGGAFVRGLVGSGISALKGDLSQAGERLLSAFPGSETVAPMLGMGKGTAPTGEDLLTDLGMERGSTAEDERRVRIAKAAGLTEYEARDKYGKFGDKRPPPDLLREFGALTKQAKESNPNLDLGATWEDSKAAADLGDVAGIGVEILTDPLTYLSFGATSAGKAAKALAAAEKAAPGLKGLLRTAGTLDDAKAILKTSKLPAKQISRLTDVLADAWKAGKPDLEFGATLGERAAKGQTALLTFGGQPVVKGEGAFKWLSTLGETDLQRSLGKGAGEGNTITEGLRGFFQPIRSKFSTGTGVGDLDELLQGRKVMEREGVTMANRALDKQARAIETVAKSKGIDVGTLNGLVTQRAELRKLSTGSYTTGKPEVELALANLSADMLKAGVTESEIAPIVAGIAEINDNIAAKLGDSAIKFNELDDEMLAYMKRHATPEGKKFLGVLNDSSLLKQRTAWDGKTIPEINKYMRDKHGVKEFFYEDPIFTTRRAVHQSQRAIANAVFGEGVIKQFGGEVAEKGSKTGVDVYKALGMKLPEGAALEELGKKIIPKDIVEFVTRSAEMQKNPSRFMKFYRAATDWMKGSVTVLFPAFHGRNMLENTMKGAMEGVTPAEYKEAGQFLMGASNINSGGPGFIDAMARKAKGALQSSGKYTPEMQKLFSENGIGKNLEEVVDWMNAQGVLENRITSELGAVLRDGPGGGAAKGASQLFGGIFGTRGAPLRTGAALASGTENWHRVSLFINRLKQGYLPAEAVNEVKRVFFDFRDLTQWESALSKNFGFFYNFYRNNMRYIAQEALRHPVRSKEMLRLFERDPDNPRFRWLSSKGALKLGGVDVSLGFLPQQQFNMFDLAEGDVFDKVRGKLGQLTGQANPMIGEALNLAYGEDLYTNTPLEYRTRAPDLAGAPDFVKSMLGYQETADGQGRMSWKANFFLNSIPAVGRLLQSTIAWDAADKSFMQKLAQLTLGVGSQVKTEEELGKRDVALIDRNITREAKSLPLLRESGHASYDVDRTTVEGRILSALATPTAKEIPYLLQDERIAARVLPYITQGPDGKPKMNKYLKDQLSQLLVDLYPRHAALFAAQKLRSKIKIKSKDQFDLQAQEGFEAMFGEMTDE